MALPDTKNDMLRLILTITFLLLLPQAFAQNAVDIETMKQRYSKYNAVITKQASDYVFDIVKDTIQVKEMNTQEVLILNDRSKAFTNDYIYYGSFSRVEDIEASTRIPGVKGYEKIPVKLFSETHNRDGQIFYDDSKTISFAYPSITAGAITSLSYTVVYLDHRLLNKGFFQSYLPIASSKITARVHKDIKLGYIMVNAEAARINYSSYSKGNYTYHVWEATDIEPYRYQNTSYFNILHYSPHISLYVSEAKTGGRTNRYYSTVDDLYKYYYGLIAGSDPPVSDDLKALVEKITSGLGDEEKARAIFYWVQDNIKYVAYSEGYLGFIPVPPSEVFAKRFGDCKGMTSLIKEMMDLAGLKTSMAWVGTRSIPYTYSQMPLPSVDNHMVAAYLRGDSVIILDGTFNYLDFGWYPYHIQGKEVLISLDEDSYRIFHVPVTPSSESEEYDSVSVTLSDQVLTGSGRRVHSGFNKVELATAMDGVKLSDYNKKFTTLFAKGNNKFRVDTSRVINLFEHDRQGEVFYEFTLEDYARVLNNEIYINLNLDKAFQNLRIDTTRLYSPVINDFCHTRKSITAFQIPEGYDVIYMPENDTFTIDDVSISFRYSREGNSIILVKEMKLDFLIVNDNRIAEWNSMIDRLNKNYRLSLVLRKSK